MLKMFPFCYNLIPFLNFHSSDDQSSIQLFQKLVQLLNL